MSFDVAPPAARAARRARRDRARDRSPRAAAARYPVAFTNLAVLAEVAPGAPGPVEAASCRSRCSCSRSSSPPARSRSRASRLSEPDQNATIVLLVDVSGSMRANDVEPTPARRRGRRDDDVPRHELPRAVQGRARRVQLDAAADDHAHLRPGRDPAVDRPARAGGRAPPSATGSRAPSTCSPPRSHAGGVRPQAGPAGPGRDRPPLRRRPEPGASSQPAQAAPAGEGRGRPRLPGLARHAERHGHLRRSAPFANQIPVPPDPATMAQIAAGDRRQGLHRPERRQRRPDLPHARLEHRPREQAGRGHLLVRGDRRRAPASPRSPPGALLGSRLP